MKRQQNLIRLNRRCSRLESHAKKLELRLESAFSFRLVIATVFAVLLIAITLNLWTQFVLIVEALLIASFVIGVFYTRRLQKHILQTRKLNEFYTRILARLNFNPLPVDVKGANKKHMKHSLALDLDLLENESVLALLDETIHIEGQGQLIQDLLEPKYDEAQVLRRQSQIVEIALRAGLIRKYIRSSHSDILTSSFGLRELLKTPLVFEGFKKTHLSLWGFCAVFWLSLLAQAFLGVESKPGLFWVLYFFYSIYCLRKIEGAFNRLQNIIQRFESLIPSFKIIEAFSHVQVLSSDLREFQNRPTEAIKKFESGSAMLSIQSNPILLFLINSFLPWNYFFVSRAESERVALNSRVDAMFKEFSWFDSIASLTLFFRYQTSTFPKFSEEFRGEEIRHPLIGTDQNVSNTFHWPKNKKLILITGSNMAGKSTFLRTIGINFVLARMGAPVFAKSFQTPLIPIRTCLRVSDNVREGFSYFYAETIRIAEILKAARDQKILYLIDEVFKGTNNKERYIGGRTLVKELAKTPSQGFVTTHDLDLSKLEFPEMANYHFKDEIRENEMHFTYKIEVGPCPTTNALRIMELAGIPISEG